MRIHEQHSEPPAGEAGFDESDGLRQTVAYRLSPADRAALGTVIRTLDALTLEVGRCWRELGEPMAVAEARAAAADLRHTVAFLARLAADGAGCDPEEEPDRVRIGRTAHRLASAVARIAEVLEAVLPERPAGETRAAAPSRRRRAAR